MEKVSSYYSQTQVTGLASYPSLAATLDCDVCIIGGGIAGLSVARGLVSEGLSVALLEANQIAWGASGRNGGFVSPGFALGYQGLRQTVGDAYAQTLLRLSLDGLEIIRETIRDYNMRSAGPFYGELNVIRHRNIDGLLKRHDINRKYLKLETELLDKPSLANYLRTERYTAGLLNPHAFQIHPLNYCLQLASTLVSQGLQLFEQTRASAIHQSDSGFDIRTQQGRVRCRELVYCTSAYTNGLEKTLDAAIVPVSTHVLLTEAISEIEDTMPGGINAVIDDRRASDYFRRVEDDRLLWGGHITTIEPTTETLEKLLRRRMLNVFPHLADVRTEMSWTGKMGYARHLMPLIGQLPTGAWVCTAFGGHGLNTATIGGQLVAKAIANNDEQYKLFAPFGFRHTFGRLGQLGVQAHYWAYQLRDWWEER